MYCLFASEMAQYTLGVKASVMNKEGQDEGQRFHTLQLVIVREIEVCFQVLPSFPPPPLLPPPLPHAGGTHCSYGMGGGGGGMSLRILHMKQQRKLLSLRTETTTNQKTCNMLLATWT